MHAASDGLGLFSSNSITYKSLMTNTDSTLTGHRWILLKYGKLSVLIYGIIYILGKYTAVVL
jgi:hypothetical protein